MMPTTYDSTELQTTDRLPFIKMWQNARSQYNLQKAKYKHNTISTHSKVQNDILWMHSEYNRALTRLAYRSTRQITDAAKNYLSVLNVVRRANIKRHAAAARNYIMSVISSSRPPSNHTNDRRQRCSRHRNTSANNINYPANLVVQAHSPSTTTQLNSTENYGRRCLTPLSPHRNYILS